MAFAELVGVASMAPFMALVGDITILQRDNLLAALYQQSGLTSEYDFVLLVGIGVLFLLIVAALISMYTTWKLSVFGVKVGTEISDRLYIHYMTRPWLFHANSSSAQLTKQIANETGRVTNQVIRPLMNMNGRLGLALFFVIAIVLYNPLVALVTVAFVGSTYSVLFLFFKRRLKENGRAISSIATERYRLMNDGFGGIKDVLLLGKQASFVESFKESSLLFTKSISSNLVIGQIPRYFMELIAFGSIIVLILYLIYSHDGNLGIILPILSIYALAGFKLLPAFQQIYGNVTQIRAGIAAFESIKEDLIASKNYVFQPEVYGQESHLVMEKNIKLHNVTFIYPTKIEPALKNVNIVIPVNKVVGLVGPSGSGKSTIIDIVLNLVEPNNGELLVDGKVICKDNRRSWQNNIGFVSQSIFLSEGSIAENIAFGLQIEKINKKQVEKALRLAHLFEFVTELPDGIHTKIGERGVQLSGGQRQRIGIARALYHNASVLVFDEATSALDGITEKMIMDAIHDFSGQKTIIIIAHRLKTVEKCDNIFFIDKGQVVDEGTFNELLTRNQHFNKLAEHA
ncbi:ABC transporter ATP-binding protein [Thiomicrorhabdus lithotrophica]|uniref:ABC transporter ATP-binding protein/permease n=1 Tax=Thiomicrorhabdus lithotrophica TaxID=2949997 RepID=A0ABY8CFE2_9GAMM|nr:ABC transporter ATP-binding protein [Thiomicrorhabdus lithotrophica]WEJ63133.1 ABC transporter ATP-binding protein/permease [Thiomicrorhabdus lithotrophica]